MDENFEIKNKVEESGLVQFDLGDLVPEGRRVGIDLKNFLFEGLVLKEKEFREKISNLKPDDYRDAFVYIYNSTEAIIPLWAYFLITSKLTDIARKIVFGSREDLEVLLMHNAIDTYDFTPLMHQKVLVKGCTDKYIPENAYIELVVQLKPIVQSLMFGEACSNVPIFKNKLS